MAKKEEPEDTRARYRSEMGFTRELEVARPNLPNPARGGSRGYSVNERMHIVDQFDRGDERSSQSYNFCGSAANYKEACIYRSI